jgi:hypothetical protein
MLEFSLSQNSPFPVLSADRLVDGQYAKMQFSRPASGDFRSGRKVLCGKLYAFD